ncbi:MAG: hypothetical protein ABIH21_01555 [Patescibacteria group bacterium]
MSDKMEQFNDYIQGIHDIAKSGFFQVSAILYDQGKEEEMLEQMHEQGLTVIDFSFDSDLYSAMQILLRRIQGGQISVLRLKEQIPDILFTQLKLIDDAERIDVQLEPSGSSVVIDPLPGSAQIILLLSEDDYKEMEIEGVINSVFKF